MELTVMHRSETGAKAAVFADQQDLVHEIGLQLTVFATADSLSDRSVVELLRSHRERYGDELGLSLHNLPGFSSDFIWLLPPEEKEQAIDRFVGQYVDELGTAPATVAAYHLDASTLRILHRRLPGLKAVVAGCFEEGVRVFHGCNHSWYLFNEGMPWWPWYPSKTHALRPGVPDETAYPFLAVPHLVRDMVLSYEGRNDYFASHPANVIRGLAHDEHHTPYDLNLIDQFRMQERWNDGYSYYSVFVGCQWLGPNPNIEIPAHEVRARYAEQLTYLADLKREGQLRDWTLSDYADLHSAERANTTATRFLAKEMLFGSGKHVFWFADPDIRATVNADQGGSIGDLRPYAGAFAGETGPQSPQLAIGSYPYVIHSQHRTGAEHHYRDGSRTTAFLVAGEQTWDVSDYPTSVTDVNTSDDGTSLWFAPVTVALSSGRHVDIDTTMTFAPGGVITIERTVTGDATGLSLREYVRAGYGWTEYPEAMHGITVSIRSNDVSQTLAYAYAGRSISGGPQTNCAAVARVPQVNSQMSLTPADGAAWQATASGGTLFDPYFTLELERPVVSGERRAVCLSIAKLV